MRRILLTFLLFQTLFGASQILVKSTFSSFSAINSQDSCLVTSGQIASEPILEMNCGYYPFNGDFSSFTKIEMNDFLIYPNPFRSGFTVNIGDYTKEVDLVIYNSTGEKVYSEKIEEQIFWITLDELSNGLYAVALFQEGELIGQQKIIKNS